MAIEATALRTESRDFRFLLAHQATSGGLTFSQIKELLLYNRADLVEQEITDPVRLGSLGRVLLLQADSAEDQRLGRRCLELSNNLTPAKKGSTRLRRLLVEDLIEAGDYEYARELLNRYPDVDREYFGYLRAETYNPFREGLGHKRAEEWLENFNQSFTQNDLLPIKLSKRAGTPFDRLQAETPHDLRTRVPVSEGEIPDVTVVLTTYKPTREGLMTSVGSILAQTWTNLELLIVDDASGEEYQDVINEVVNLDPRIRLITCEQNGGTYRARNIGFSQARGELVTGQDDDDWSHPQRLELQVEALELNKAAPGCRTRAISCTENLSRVRRGYKPEGANASSLMVRRNVMNAAGGFLPIRKAADNELAQRIEAITGQAIIDIKKPLAIIRILKDSLSRSHFRPGWQHPARRQFRSAYNFWHRHAPKADLQLDPNEFPPISIPRALRADPNSFPTRVEVVFAGDWRHFGGPQKSMLEEITALTESGYSVGILHLEAARFMATETQPLCEPIQKLVNAGKVQEVLYDDPVEVELLILRYPPILQFPPASPSALNVKRLIVLANQAPAELDGSDIRYLVSDCHKNANLMFKRWPLWVPQGPQVRDAIRSYLNEASLAEFDMPGIVNPGEWRTDRGSRRSLIPVVGRHSRDNPMKWPNSAETLARVYPGEGIFDVRILGGAKVALQVLDTTIEPPGWTVYSANEMSPLSFLQSLDYYVFYQHEQAIEAFGRAILEALATGLVVILPERFRQVFGEAAVYKAPKDVLKTIRYFHEHPIAYEEQSKRALQAVEQRFSHKSYRELIAPILAEPVESVALEEV
ncbi:glycosyltransferase [Enteractinococcus coprophilus]|nr:glycosyltransferase [Enteractinococcus coprophilus]